MLRLQATLNINKCFNLVWFWSTNPVAVYFSTVGLTLSYCFVQMHVNPADQLTPWGCACSPGGGAEMLALSQSPLIPPTVTLLRTAQCPEVKCIFGATPPAHQTVLSIFPKIIVHRLPPCTQIPKLMVKGSGWMQWKYSDSSPGVWEPS